MSDLDIAIVGMAGRFPGARSVEEFWRNVSGGVESISFFTDDEVRAAGVEAALLADPHYVKAGGVLDDIEWFDAGFFGYTPREAEVTDPQQRIFLECAWHALENAGYDSERYRRPIGVYAGMSMNSYVLSNLIFNPAAVEAIGEAQAAISNLHDHLATRVAYTLDLRGPSFTVQTACSTSLVAVHLACQGLLGGECDMALAGGVSVGVPQKAGYLYAEGGTHSPDGHCRAFDAAAQGMVGGSGVGIVVLKRLEDAVADGDRIVAIVKGTAINNDGASKVGYTAPSVEGQARVVRAALRAASVAPESISYIEAHGTGTAIGDPIEVEALSRVFRTPGARPGRCGLGSVKSNVGHLDAAAGVAGLIKTALALQHRQLPPSLHFERPNPRIDFAATPFYVVGEGRPWPADATPRRAGVSAFGIGGTNAHAVLEEAPPVAPGDVSERPEVFVVSARTASALDAARLQLASHLDDHPDLPLADVAWTLQAGRRGFPLRAAAIGRSHHEVAALLRGGRAPRLLESREEPVARRTAFLFPGQGSQYPGMGSALYGRFKVFRDAVDAVADAVRPSLGADLREILGYDSGAHPNDDERLRGTRCAQPALFAVSYATAQLLISAGITPAACVGHSVGEYVAACLAGVLTVADAGSLVAARGRLMSEATPGAMLAVALPERDVIERLDDRLMLAAINGPSACVVSGDFDAIDRIEHELRLEGVAVARLRTSHAFHSHLMDDVVARFEAEVASRTLAAPRIPFVSNLTGRWIETSEATDPHYWARHLREPVRFASGIEQASAMCSRLIEAGPGTALTTLARQVLGQRDISLVTTLPRAAAEDAADSTFLTAVARLWTEQVPVDWRPLSGTGRRRVALPAYPFERQRYWVDPIGKEPAGLRARPPAPADGLQFYLPAWQRAIGWSDASAFFATRRRWLVVCDAFGLGEAVAQRLERAGQSVTAVAGEPHRPTAADYDSWLASVRAQGGAPDAIVYCASAAPDAATDLGGGRQAAFDGVIGLIKALESRRVFTPVRLEVVSSNVWDVIGDEPLDPLQSLLIGPLRVVPQEYPTVHSRNIDVSWGTDADVGRLADRVVAELATASDAQAVAIRAGHRWTQHYVPAPSAAAQRDLTGPAVIFGGLGSIGQVAAIALVEAGVTQLVLAGRRVDAPAASIGELERRGAEVLTVAADVEDEAAVRAVFARTRQRFGRAAIVIHAAGPGGSSAIGALADDDGAHVDVQFGAKVRGLLALAAVVRQESPALVVLTSSLSTVLGGLGFGAYASSNAVMDAMAAARNRGGDTRWVAVDWDGWRFDVSTAAGSIDRATGGAAFTRLLRQDLGARVLVTADALEPRLARWINPGVRAAATTGGGVRRIATAAAPAGSDLERLVMQAWVELLGVSEVGVDDNFFDLGGHSLLATQLVSRLRRALMLDVPLRAIFEQPTIRAMAAAIVEREPTPGQAAAAAALRLKLGQLTPEQLKMMIAARQPAAQGAGR